MKNHLVEKLNLVLAILVSLYFTGMILMSYEILMAGKLALVFIELLTIPSLLVLIYVFIYGVIRMISGRFSKILLLGLLISLITIGGLIYVTYKESSV